MNINQRKTNKYSNPAFSLAIKYICIFVYNFINIYRVPFQGFTNILFFGCTCKYNNFINCGE